MCRKSILLKKIYILLKKDTTRKWSYSHGLILRLSLPWTFLMSFRTFVYTKRSKTASALSSLYIFPSKLYSVFKRMSFDSSSLKSIHFQKTLIVFKPFFIKKVWKGLNHISVWTIGESAPPSSFQTGVDGPKRIQELAFLAFLLVVLWLRAELVTKPVPVYCQIVRS